MCVGNCGMDFGFGLRVACLSGMKHLGYVVFLSGLESLKLSLECRRLRVWVSVSL